MRWYGLSVLGGIVFGALAIAVLNGVVDPYGREISRLGALKSDAYLIGTSRYGNGFDVCRRPGVQKVSISGGGLGVLVRAQNAILAQATAPKTLVLEATAPSHSLPYPISLAGGIGMSLEAIFSYRATAASLKALGRAALGTQDGGPIVLRCSAEADAERPPIDQDLRRARMLAGLEVTAAGATAFRQSFRNAVLDAEKACHDSGIRHTIRWFHLPLTSDALRSSAIQDTMAQWWRIMGEVLTSPRPHAGACDIALASHAVSSADPESTRWTIPERWLDYNHFGVTLGETALRALPEVFPLTAPSRAPL